MMDRMDLFQGALRVGASVLLQDCVFIALVHHQAGGQLSQVQPASRLAVHKAAGCSAKRATNARYVHSVCYGC
jgi:hypothetical protein